MAGPEAPEACTNTLSRKFREVRSASERLCDPLETEDYIVQSMPDVSPTRWHLAHVTWFFETFVLKRHVEGYLPLHAEFEHLFNSYYNAVGEPYPRPRRGLLTRPTVKEVYAYRARVDEAMQRLLEEEEELGEEVSDLIELGLHHEQQHQELILTDIKHVFSCNPLYPVYKERSKASRRDPLSTSTEWIVYPEGPRFIGHEGPGFAYDHEMPRHRVLVPEFKLAPRLVDNRQYMEFIEAGGYQEPELWLADGWITVRKEGWKAPYYWVPEDGAWSEFTLNGLKPLDLDAPVCHVSYYEADAFARWAGALLPTEAEWEAAAQQCTVGGNFVEKEFLHPRAPQENGSGPRQLFGDLWEWTRSAFAPYPGFQAAEGAIGEYNGKFMCNQYVLRGGACVTPLSHIRPTYRNFFYPHSRWQFSGIRLARNT